MTEPATTPTTTPAGQVDGGTTPTTPVAPQPGTPTTPGTTTPPEGKGQGSAITPAQKPTEGAGEIEVKLPEGAVMDEALMKEFKSKAKEWKLNSDQASQAAGFYVAQIQAQEDAFKKLDESWAAEIQRDSEIGGEKLEENKERMRKVVKEIGGQQLIDDIEKFRLGNLPSLVRFVWKCRDLIKEDNSALKPAGPSGSLSGEQQLRRDYPSMFNADGTPINK